MSVSLRNSSQYKVSSLSGIRKIVIGFLVLSAFLLLLLSSSPFLLKSNADTLASNLNNNHRDNSILSTHDTDGDGIDDATEDSIGTDKSDPKGDKDGDGLYDFEEYLDLYGTPDIASDTPKYAYNDATTFDDDNNEPILDIYHYFNFSKNGTGFLRDDSSGGQRSGFTNHLLWNVTFSADYAGGRGSDGGSVLYLNNTIVGCTFSGQWSGGSQTEKVNYTNNVFMDTRFTGTYSGGSEFGGSGIEGPVVVYINNTFTNVIFSNDASGGGESNDNGNIYRLNTFTNVNFTGGYAGGSDTGPVTYGNNSFTSVIFSGRDAGFSVSSTTKYENNTFDRVKFSGTQNMDFARFTYKDNTIVENGDTYDSDGDELMDLDELFTKRTNPSKLDTDGDTLNDSYEIEIGLKANDSDSDGDGYKDQWELKYNGSYGLDPKNGATGINESIDLDRDGLNFSLEAKALTDPNDLDTDDDGLNDSYEYFNLTSDPTLFDTDSDGLNDSDENERGTDPAKPDTDGDGLRDGDEVAHGTNPLDPDTDKDSLNDGWEVQYQNVQYVDPLDKAMDADLASDTDDDGLNLLHEEGNNTNPGNPDTDDDGLPDGWEVLYQYVPGVHPRQKASNSQLALDNDKDGLNLSQEAEALTNPRNNDTDDDSLGDRWEVLYKNVQHVDPLVGGADLASDTDGDGLNLSQEAKAFTNPGNPDTDGDGLNDSYEVLTLMTNATLADTDGDGLGDRWEVKYNGTSGVNPLVPATAEELASDTDNDGLNLTEEFKANLDPGTADNPMPRDTTTSTTVSASSSSGEITVEGSFALLVVLAIFTSFSLVFVVYRMRRRML